MKKLILSVLLMVSMSANAGLANVKVTSKCVEGYMFAIAFIDSRTISITQIFVINFTDTRPQPLACKY